MCLSFYAALLGQQFLESTASQLTYHGICELSSAIKEGDLCVFFRNNHFNTLMKRMYKREGKGLNEEKGARERGRG